MLKSVSWINCGQCNYSMPIKILNNKHVYHGSRNEWINKNRFDFFNCVLQPKNYYNRFCVGVRRPQLWNTDRHYGKKRRRRKNIFFEYKFCWGFFFFCSESPMQSRSHSAEEFRIQLCNIVCIRSCINNNL